MKKNQFFSSNHAEIFLNGQIYGQNKFQTLEMIEIISVLNLAFNALQNEINGHLFEGERDIVIDYILDKVFLRNYIVIDIKYM